MDRSFWDARWQAGQIGFHLSAVNPQLVRHAETLGSPDRVLVPLCGKSVDLAWLAERGAEVMGVEFIDRAAREFFAEQGSTPEELTLGKARALHSGGVTIIVSDVFDVNTSVVEPFAAVYDRAALIALEPGRRRAYLAHLRTLLTANARVLMVTLDHDLGTGPPFAVDPASMPGLTQGLFSLTLVDDTDVLASEPRFRDRGAQRLREQVWTGVTI